MTTLKQQYEAAKDTMDKVLTAIADKIRALPDNPRIHRLSNQPQCFVLSSKDLAKNWSVEHHDFALQYRLVAAELMASDTGKVLNKLRYIISTEQVGRSWCQGRVNLHDDVVKQLKAVLAEIEGVPDDDKSKMAPHVLGSAQSEAGQDVRMEG